MSGRYVPSILSIEEAKKLIDACYYREMAAIKVAHYQTPTDQAKDMHACNSAHAAAIDLLNDEESDNTYADRKKEEIRQTLWQFVRGSLRNAIENIRNMTLRQQYISAIKTKVFEFRTGLDNLRVNVGGMPGHQINEIVDAALANLAEQATAARNATLAFTRAKLSKTTLAFSQWIKEEGLSYRGLLVRYTQRARSQGRVSRGIFEELSNEERVVVYEDIIMASGRSNVIVNNFSRVVGVMGVATVILTLGCIVWDVAESSNSTLTAVNDAIILGAGVICAELGTELGAAVGSVGGPLGIFIGGVLGGIIAGFGTGLAANKIFDAMVAAFSVGIPSDLFSQSLWGSPIVYTPLLPDGRDLSTSLFPSQPL